MTTAGSAYAITEGGLLRRIESTLRLARGDRYDWLRRAAAFLLVTYVPALLVGLGWRIIDDDWLPALVLFQPHVRALISIPLLLAAEPLVDARARGVGRYVLASRLVTGARDGYDAAIARTVRWRDSYLVEVVLLAVAIGTTLMEVSYVTGASRFQWVNAPTIALFRFLLLRWMWRWSLWASFLWRVSRLRLALRTTHPDRMGGLGSTLGPSHVMPVVAAACSATIAAGWAQLMLRDQVPLRAFYDTAIVYVFAVIVVILLPACAFIPSLSKARKEGLGSYGAFAHRFAYSFEERWSDASGEEALGAPDISSLADLGGSYAVVREMRVFPWTRRLVVVIVAWSLLPIGSLALIVIDLPALLGKLVNLPL